MPFGSKTTVAILYYLFYQAAVVSILLYGCTTWTLTKRLKKKLDGNYTRMLRAILNKSWRQHPTRNRLHGHLPPITKTIQVRRTRHAGHCWRSKDELISDILPWTSAYGQAKAGQPARTYIQQLLTPVYGQAKAGQPARTYTQQLREDTGCSPEHLPEAMNDREKWRERVRDVRASGMTWSWWWWWYHIYSSLQTRPCLFYCMPFFRGNNTNYTWFHRQPMFSNILSSLVTSK